MLTGDHLYVIDRAALIQDGEDPPGDCGLAALLSLSLVLMPVTTETRPVQELELLQLTEYSKIRSSIKYS